MVVVVAFVAVVVLLVVVVVAFVVAFVVAALVASARATALVAADEPLGAYITADTMLARSTTFVSDVKSFTTKSVCVVSFA